MFIIYSSFDEILICTEEKEAEAKKEYFEDGDRNINDYDREVSNDCFVVVHARLKFE